jgi:hypothetical protein
MATKTKSFDPLKTIHPDILDHYSDLRTKPWFLQWILPDRVGSGDKIVITQIWWWMEGEIGQTLNLQQWEHHTHNPKSTPFMHMGSWLYTKDRNYHAKWKAGTAVERKFDGTMDTARAVWNQAVEQGAVHIIVNN